MFAVLIHDWSESHGQNPVSEWRTLSAATPSTLRGSATICRCVESAHNLSDSGRAPRAKKTVINSDSCASVGNNRRNSHALPRDVLHQQKVLMLSLAEGENAFYLTTVACHPPHLPNASGRSAEGARLSP